MIVLSIMRGSAFEKYGWRNGFLLELLSIPIYILCVGLLYLYECFPQEEESIALIKTGKDLHPSYGIQFNPLDNECRETPMTTADHDSECPDIVSASPHKRCSRVTTSTKQITLQILQMSCCPTPFTTKRAGALG